MFHQNLAALLPSRAKNQQKKLLNALCSALLLCSATGATVFAQAVERELNAPEKATVTIKNRNGRVMVIASDDQQKKISIKATSPGASIIETDVRSNIIGSAVDIEARERNERDRIDLLVRVPARASVKVQSENGAVDIIGNLASAEVETNTGTILASVPLDAVRFNFVWQASRPRYFSEVELPQVKERAGGEFAIGGKLGDKKAKKEARVELDFTTQRGVILFNVDPSMVPTDLRDRPLTEAARAIVRSGNSKLVEAIRKVAPRMFGDYAQALPPPKTEPSLVERHAPAEVATPVTSQLMRLNASVTDAHGRAIGGLQAKDFTVIENGEARKVTDVAQTNAPFNLVLLLDVSGSVEDRIDFIRKAGRNFLNTVSAQDRIAIISFRDDIQIISNFTTDRRLLSESLEQIDAGGATALYDALAYVLVDTLKPLRGERTAVVIMSDGDDNKSFIPFGAVLDETIESGALIYPLYVPSGLIPQASAPAPDATLDPLRTRFMTLTTRATEEGRRLASASGGVYYPITRLEDLQRAYQDVVTQLRTSYTITYATTASASTLQRERRVRVRVNREGASVRLSPVVGVSP